MGDFSRTGFVSEIGDFLSMLGKVGGGGFGNRGEGMGTIDKFLKEVYV